MLKQPEIESLSDNSITASQMLEYLYCPRFTYFEYVMDIPQNEGQRFKVEKGRNIHENVRKTNPEYLRKKIGVIDRKSDVYLASSLGIRGIVDEVLFLDDNTAAPLDYKFAEYKNKLFKTYRFQLIFYARLIKDNFQIPVKKGFIIYTRSKNKLVEVSLKDKDFIELEKIIDDMTSIIQNCRYPKPTSVKRRCLDCCYRNLCERTI
jgi:CRISPR-associated exonuclease Cas4